MSALSSVDILREMKEGNIIIEPFNVDQLNPNSYDVCLGEWFVPIGIHINPKKGDTEVLFGAPVVLSEQHNKYRLGTSTLAITKEIVGTKRNIFGVVYTKSSVQRIGISVTNDGGLGDIGFCNRWTLSLSIPAPCYRILTLGQRIAQIVFFYTHSPVQKEYSGQYTENDFPLMMIPKQYREEWTNQYGWLLEE